MNWRGRKERCWLGQGGIFVVMCYCVTVQQSCAVRPNELKFPCAITCCLRAKHLILTKIHEIRLWSCWSTLMPQIQEIPQSGRIWDLSLSDIWPQCFKTLPSSETAVFITILFINNLAAQTCEQLHEWTYKQKTIAAAVMMTWCSIA